MLQNQYYPRLIAHNKEKHANNTDDAVISTLNEFMDYTAPLFYQKLAFVSVSGSRLYNTVAFTGSENDIDVVGIYLCDTRQLLGIDDKKKDFLVPAVRNNNPDTIDYTVYELSRFVHLLITCNPAAIEVLFGCEKKLYITTDNKIDEEWNLLLEKRSAFITKDLVKNLLGYAKSQVADAVRKKDQEDTPHARKAIYHAIRVVSEAQRIVNGQEPLVHLDDDNEIRQQILDVRIGKIPFQTAKSLYQDMLSQVEKDMTGQIYSDLPYNVQSGTKDWLHEWMIRIRLSRLLL
jgi:predicted nucleotidyltransferase